MLTKEQILKLDERAPIDEPVEVVFVSREEWEATSLKVMQDYALEMELLK